MLPARDADAVSALLAVDPVGLGGAVLCGGPGLGRELWLAGFAGLLPAGAPVRRVPPGTTAERLIGGLDLTATLASGRVELERGLIARADGGVLVVTMAERLEPGAAAQLALAMDRRAVLIERDGVGAEHPAAVCVVALDESDPGEAGAAAALLDRLAFRLDPPEAPAEPVSAERAAAARRRLRSVRADDETVAALCGAALALGVPSLRAAFLALAAAKAAAALEHRTAPSEGDLALAARLVLGPRATRLPADEAVPEPPPQPPPEAGESDPSDDRADAPLADRVLAAVRVALPADLLAANEARGARAPGRGAGGEVPATHGRRAGSRPGRPGGGRRLDVLETIRAAAPWQRLRGRPAGDATAPLRIRGGDLRVRRLVRKAGTTLIFVVDASGSTALQRLAEAKGAVELLLAESYVRRDRVALVSFRGRGAELLLPPTRSPARARRALAALPGGGGTPLASGLDAARGLAGSAARGGDGVPLVVLLTDGRPNVARDGTGGRQRAEADALEAARAIRRESHRAVVIDTGRLPGAFAARLSAEMGARYVPLPAADAARVHAAVLAARPDGGR